MDTLAMQNAGTTHKKLWQAVIDSAIAEWLRGSVQHRRTAEHFLLHDENDFPFVCRFAGLNPESVRESLWAIRAQAKTKRIPRLAQENWARTLPQSPELGGSARQFQTRFMPLR